MRNGRVRIAIPTPSLGRRRSSSCLRTIIIISFVMFIWLQLQLSNINDCETVAGEDPNRFASIFNMIPKDFHKYLKPRPQIRNGTLEKLRLRLNPNISEIQANIGKYNEMQFIHNVDIYGPLLNDTLIIVVQVHKRISYLRHLIVSLAQARDIDTVLLVFSHDYYDEEINDLVQSIDFCKVLQIFYPHSIQTHPHTFPGPSPDDCPRNMKKEEALIKKCVNAEWPDLYGHYREAKFTQTKHHWWWKANRVFSQLEITRYHSGLVLFLEEDHYVAEDFIYLLQLMQETAKKSCKNCNIYSLGTYLKSYVYYANARKRALKALKRYQNFSSTSFTPNWGFQILPSLYQHYPKMEITSWISSKHNMGMALNRSVWNQIKKCSINFCTYDDYNWDWSLQNVSNNCLSRPLEVMMARGPRVFHIGECGFHHKKQNCEASTIVSRVQQILKTAKKYLYPRRLTLVYTTQTRKQQIKGGNGGWKDLRDHQLCLNISLVGREPPIPECLLAWPHFQVSVGERGFLVVVFTAATRATYKDVKFRGTWSRQYLDPAKYRLALLSSAAKASQS